MQGLGGHGGDARLLPQVSWEPCRVLSRGGTRADVRRRGPSMRLSHLPRAPSASSHHPPQMLSPPLNPAPQPPSPARACTGAWRGVNGALESRAGWAGIWETSVERGSTQSPRPLLLVTISSHLFLLVPLSAPQMAQTWPSPPPPPASQILTHRAERNGKVWGCPPLTRVSHPGPLPRSPAAPGTGYRQGHGGRAGSHGPEHWSLLPELAHFPGVPPGPGALPEPCENQWSRRSRSPNIQPNYLGPSAPLNRLYFVGHGEVRDSGEGLGAEKYWEISGRLGNLRALWNVWGLGSVVGGRGVSLCSSR